MSIALAKSFIRSNFPNLSSPSAPSDLNTTQLYHPSAPHLKIEACLSARGECRSKFHAGFANLHIAAQNLTSVDLCNKRDDFWLGRISNPLGTHDPLAGVSHVISSF